MERISILGTIFRQARLNCGLSQTQVAEEIGIVQPFLSQIEAGISTAPRGFSRIVHRYAPEHDRSYLMLVELIEKAFFRKAFKNTMFYYDLNKKKLVCKKDDKVYLLETVSGILLFLNTLTEELWIQSQEILEKAG